MKRFIRWIFFSNLLPDGKEGWEIAWVAVMGTISILLENVALAVAQQTGNPVLNPAFPAGIVWLLWMMLFAAAGFGSVGVIVMPTGLALVAYGVNVPSTWSLLEVLLGLCMTLRSFSVGSKKRTF